MSAATSPSFGLKQIGPDVYVSGATVTASLNDEGPRVIVVFGWMNAQIQHLRKYVDYYKNAYPYANVLLVCCWSSFFWSTNTAREATLSPVVAFLKAQSMFESPTPGMLVHTFSNGGAFQFATLSRMLDDHPTSSDSGPAPAIGLIFDSCPGHLGTSSALQAFTVSIKPPLLKYLAYIPLALFLFFHYFVRFLSQRPPLTNSLRKRLLEPRILPWTSAKTPRLYIYSDKDALVRAHAVEEHIADARRLGLNVRGELYHGSEHVSHARADPERYWAAVQSVWAEAKANNTDSGHDRIN